MEVNTTHEDKGQMKRRDETMGKQLGLHLKRRKGEQEKEGPNRGKNFHGI
jgi:hypothetical protein